MEPLTNILVEASSAPSKTESVVTPQRVIFAIQNRFNPIRHFTPEKLVRQLDSFQAGYLAEAARTWEMMERRDLMLGNVAAKRKKAVSRLTWDIVTVDESDAAKEQAEYLKDFYNAIEATSALEQDERGGVGMLIRQMMDAVGKKFAVHEIVWRPGAVEASRRQSGDAGSELTAEKQGAGRSEPGAEQGKPVLSAEFIFCPLWWFENRTGRLRYLTQEGLQDGEEMRSGEWLVTVGEGIMEGCSIGYVYKHMPLKDWLAYSEKFGMPGVLGKSSATPDSAQWNAMEDAVRSFGQDFGAVCSQTDALEIVEVKGGSQNLPFPPLVEYCDRMMAARWRGADLSTISQGKEGVGASLQGDETDLILGDDAALITETLNVRVDPFVIRYGFGEGAQTLAFFKLQASDATKEETAFKRQAWLQFLMDGTVNDIMANLTDLKELTGEVGIPVNQEYIDPYLPVQTTGAVVRDSAGDIVGAEAPELPEKPSALPGLENERSTALQGNERIVAENLKPFVAATQEVFRPVATRLQEALAITDPSLRAVKLREVQDWIASGKAAKEVNADPKNAKALTSAMEAALKRGFGGGTGAGGGKAADAPSRSRL